MGSIIRLSEKEQLVFTAYQLQARASAEDIAKEVDLKPHVVRHALDSLKRREAIWYLPYIDVGQLGYTDCCIFFNHAASSVGSRQRLLSAISASSNVAYLAELAGEFQYTAGIYYKEFREVAHFLTTIAEAAGGALVEKSLATRTRWSFFRTKSLHSMPSTVESLTCGARNEKAEIDELDDRILKVLARSKARPWSWVAREAKIPNSTLEHRVTKLTAAGVIAGHVFKLAPPYSGLHKFRIIISQLHPAPRLERTLYHFAAEHPYISCFVKCLGNWDYELSVEVDDPRKLPEVLEQIESQFQPHIASRKVISVLNHHKISLYPF